MIGVAVRRERQLVLARLGAQVLLRQRRPEVGRGVVVGHHQHVPVTALLAVGGGRVVPGRPTSDNQQRDLYLS